MSKRSIAFSDRFIMLFVAFTFLAGCSAPAATPASTTTPAPSPALAQSSATTGSSTFPENLFTYVEGLAASDQFSGVILIARDGMVVASRAFGLADRELEIPNQPDTRFNLGSINKSFTAVAILQLVEQGLLSLDATIGEVMPDYTNSEVASQVTIHQLLTHTSGMGDYLTSAYLEYRAVTPLEQLMTPSGTLPLFVDWPLQFKPGSQYGYSNEGYLVLGLVIERVSGMSYYDYVQQNIYTPAGMSHTDSFVNENLPANTAIGYTSMDMDGNDTGSLVANTGLLTPRGLPDGGGYSTAGDLLLFFDALLSNQLLSAEYTALLLEGKVEIREGVSYAYGFIRTVITGQPAITNGGNAPGVCDQVWVFPDSDLTIIDLSNTDSGCLLVRQFLMENLAW